MVYDAIIIGGGACGLMCGIEAGRLRKKVVVLERNEKVGAKILISGGGRCNYTNLHTTSKNFISENPDFSKSIFSQWTVDDTVNFFEKNRIFGQEKTLGQLFPITNKAKDIIDVFINILIQYKVPVHLNALVTEVEQNDLGIFSVHYESNGRKTIVQAKAVVLASGGLPIAKLGASDFALRVARKYGMKVTETSPALVPLTITGKEAEWFKALSGNSVFSTVSTKEISFQENILFTHWGLSGPAILQISSYVKPGEEIEIDLLPNQSFADHIAKEREIGGRRVLSQLLHEHFTKRFCEALGKYLPIDTKIASMSKKDAKLVVDTIHHFKVKPAGNKGYDKAEVMIGGVSTDELNAETLESLVVPNLYFGGEAVDVTGWLGGYNFQWAWASGVVIARNI